MVGQSRNPLLVQCRSIVYDAGSTPLQHWPNAWFFYTRVYSNRWTAKQCCFNVDPTCLTMAQQQPSILYYMLLSANCYRGDNFIPRGQKGHYPDTLAQLWNDAGPPSATLGQHYSNQNHLSSYYRLNHIYNREYYYFWTLVKDKST